MVPLLLVVAFKAQAMPEKIHYIFLAEKSRTSFHQILNEHLSNKSSEKIAELSNSDIDCTPMGEGCFHPQFGYMNRKGTIKISDEESLGTKDTPSLFEETKQTDFSLKTINAEEVNMLECKEGNYFDIFCGGASKKSLSEKYDLEVWIDTSASMKNVDFTHGEQPCHRQRFVKELRQSCKGLEVKNYNTSLKQNADPSYLCTDYGSNDEARLISWIQQSNSKVLFIVTDVAEMSREMKDFLDRENAKVYGLERSFQAKSLISLIPSMQKSCKN